MGLFFAISMWTLKNYRFGFQSVQSWAHRTHAGPCSPLPDWQLCQKSLPAISTSRIVLKIICFWFWKEFLKICHCNISLLKAEKDAFLVTQMLLKEVWNRAVWPTGALQTQSQTGSSETKGFRVGVKDPLGQWEGKIRPGFFLTPL